MIKRVLTTIGIIILAILVLSGCGENSATENSGTEVSSETPVTYSGALLGHWISEAGDYGDAVVFTEDNVIEYYRVATDTAPAKTGEFTDRGTEVTLCYTDSGEETHVYSVSGDTLTVVWGTYSINYNRQQGTQGTIVP